MLDMHDTTAYITLCIIVIFFDLAGWTGVSSIRSVQEAAVMIFFKDQRGMDRGAKLEKKRIKKKKCS